MIQNENQRYFFPFYQFMYGVALGDSEIGLLQNDSLTMCSFSSDSLEIEGDKNTLIGPCQNLGVLRVDYKQL